MSKYDPEPIRSSKSVQQTNFDRNGNVIQSPCGGRVPNALVNGLPDEVVGGHIHDMAMRSNSAVTTLGDALHRLIKLNHRVAGYPVTQPERPDPVPLSPDAPALQALNSSLDRLNAVATDIHCMIDALERL